MLDVHLTILGKSSRWLVTVGLVPTAVKFWRGGGPKECVLVLTLHNPEIRCFGRLHFQGGMFHQKPHTVSFQIFGLASDRLFVGNLEFSLTALLSKVNHIAWTCRTFTSLRSNGQTDD